MKKKKNITQPLHQSSTDIASSLIRLALRTIGKNVEPWQGLVQRKLSVPSSLFCTPGGPSPCLSVEPNSPLQPPDPGSPSNNCLQQVTCHIPPVALSSTLYITAELRLMRGSWAARASDLLSSF